MTRRYIPKTERHVIYRKCDGHCCYCGRKIELKEMQVDHYYPFSLNEYYTKNSRILVDDGYNLMPSCRSCNHYKRGDTPEDFRTKMKSIHLRLKKVYIFNVAVNFGAVTITPFDGEFWFEKNPQFGIIYPTSLNLDL